MAAGVVDPGVVVVAVGVVVPVGAVPVVDAGVAVADPSMTVSGERPRAASAWTPLQLAPLVPPALPPDAWAVRLVWLRATSATCGRARKRRSVVATRG